MSTGPVVDTPTGKVRGSFERTSDNFEYCSFKGIPYAEKPLGELRFKDPVPVRKWSAVLNAKEYKPMCIQYDPISRVHSDTEDCLYLNVYVKSIDDKNANKAVMVWIHGGGFFFGSADDTFYGPDYLLKKDVVLVTVGYRLGVLGFLDLEDEVAPGNQGLKDQVRALEWVRDNICSFGGNPDNVTVFGESAGGASAHYLALSPLSKDLLHKVISQSGVAVNCWAHISTNPKINALELCSKLGKPELTDPKKIVEFLRTVDCKKLHEVQEEMYKTKGVQPFGPGVDDKSPKPFMPIPVEKKAEEGVHIPYLLGYNSREGMFFLLDEFSFADKKKEEILNAYDQNFELMLTFNSKSTIEKYGLTPQQIRRLYYKSEKISNDNIDVFVDMISDLFFTESIHRVAKIQVEKSSAPTYLYRLSYDPNFSLCKSLMSTKISGVSHFDDIGYLFKMKLYDRLGLPHLSEGTESYRIMERMTEMWTNFAKYGQPVINTSDLTPVHWQPANSERILRYLNIDEDVTMQNVLNIEEKYKSARSIKTE